jgi:Flp pilus assembly pilin Flp
MSMLMYARTWLVTRLHRDEAGQGVVEYVLVTLGVSLFLIFAAIALRGILTTAVTAIGTWIGLVGTPGPLP